MNLCVPAMDRLARSGILGKLTRWEQGLGPNVVNRVAMGCWASLFSVLLFTGSVDAPHPGSNIAFWKKAYDEHKHLAGEKLLKVVQTKAEKGSGAAFNSLGQIYLEGKLLPADRAAAVRCFAKASELGSVRGSINVVKAHLFLGSLDSQEALDRALKEVEQECATGTDAEAFFVLGGAFETGQGRAQDAARALALYEEGCKRGNAECCKALERIRGGGKTGAAAPQR
jgi:TPR repeat protein